MRIHHPSLPRDFGRACRVTAMAVGRDPSGEPRLRATVAPEAGRAAVHVELARPHPLDDALQLFLADRVLVTEDAGGQREFGRVHVEFWIEDAYHEFWADDYREPAEE